MPLFKNHISSIRKATIFMLVAFLIAGCKESTVTQEPQKNGTADKVTREAQKK